MISNKPLLDKRSYNCEDLYRKGITLFPELNSREYKKLKFKLESDVLECLKKFKKDFDKFGEVIKYYNIPVEVINAYEEISQSFNNNIGELEAEEE